MAKKNKEKEVKREKGQPRSFPTAEDFEYRFKSYIDWCADKKRFPNIAGFCAYCHITRDTFYAQKEYYSDTYNIVNSILEDEVLQDNTYRAQLYLKNKFGYVDRQQVESKIESHNVNENHNYTELSKKFWANATDEERKRWESGDMTPREEEEIANRT